MYNFGIHFLEHFSCKNLRKPRSNLPKPNWEQPEHARVHDVAPGTRAGAVYPAPWAPGPDVEAPRAPCGRRRRVGWCSGPWFPPLIARHARTHAAPTDEPWRRRTRAAPTDEPRRRRTPPTSRDRLTPATWSWSSSHRRAPIKAPSILRARTARRRSAIAVSPSSTAELPLPRLTPTNRYNRCLPTPFQHLPEPLIA
jgi:hypothetical protein